VTTSAGLVLFRERTAGEQSFPEVDRVAWFDIPTAATKIVRGQARLLERLADARSG